jgi:collagenase-like PrtC family protease
MLLPMQFTVSARGKAAAVPIQQFIRKNYSDLPLEQIDSFFGFTEASTLYGGRIFSNTELSRYDVRSLYKMNINVRLPLTNHFATPEEYEENQPFLEKYHRPGNSLIITNDELARWVRTDFPYYKLEASVIKNINNLRKVEAAFEIYDTVILPMASNDDEALLKSIGNKKNITLFANAGCAYTCPSKICYVSISKANKTGDGSVFQCSQKLKERNMIGMYDFDLDHLQDLGFERFKLLRPRQGNMTGF